jgi:hypothetical protein
MADVAQSLPAHPRADSPRFGESVARVATPPAAGESRGFKAPAGKCVTPAA